MKYLQAIQYGAISLVLFTIAAIIIPGYGASTDVQIILTVSTFLFAILAGFFISRLNARYNKITDAYAQEDAIWLSLYKTSMFFGKNFQDRIRELIDKYYIIAYDLIGSEYKYNTKYLHAVYDELNKENISKNLKAETVFDDMVMFLYEIEKIRNQSSVSSLDKLTGGQWVILLFLSAIIIFSIFFLKTPSLYSNITTVLLSTILVLILFTARDLQNMRLTGSSLVTESGQELFEFIGKMRYYPESHVKSGLYPIPDYVKKYRLGLHEPGAKEFKIKVVNNK